MVSVEVWGNFNDTVTMDGCIGPLTVGYGVCADLYSGSAELFSNVEVNTPPCILQGDAIVGNAVTLTSEAGKRI